MLVIYFAVIFATLTQAWISDEKAEQLSEQCCPPNAWECCSDALKYHIPLKCLDKMPFDKTIEAINCLQSKMFPNSSFNIDASYCCHIFSKSEEDPTDICAANCRNTLLTVAMEPEKRLKKASHCGNHFHTHTCFKKCLKQQQESNYKDSFSYYFYC